MSLAFYSLIPLIAIVSLCLLGSLKHRNLAAMEALRAAKEALKAKNRNSVKVHRREGSNLTDRDIGSLQKTHAKCKIGQFECPIMTSDEVKWLEASVRQDVNLWNQYVDHLRATMEEYKDLAEVLRRTFGDEVFMSHSYTTALSRKPSLRNYSIFSDCMLEAWPEMTRASLYDDLADAVSKIKDSVYRRQMRDHRKHI